MWSLKFDDDIAAGSDRYDTDGFALTRAPSSTPPPDWAVRIARSLLWVSEGSQIRPACVLGQSAFTPRDITRANPPLDGRPSAGWPYATIGLDVEADRRSNQLWLTLGVVGPASLAEQTQRAIHRITPSPAPLGWDTQLHNEPRLVLAYQHAWQGLAAGSLAGLEFDLVTPNTGGALGNVYA